jgi:hypothetical protein
MQKKPNVNSDSEKELAHVEKQFEAHKENVESMTLDRMNMAPKLEMEPQTKLSSNQIANSKDIYLKPFKTIGCADKFQEQFREDYNFDKQYVQFTAENNEVVGETIDMWTRPYPGMPAEEWKVPVNKPVWGPRYLAEQIKRCCYHRLSMNQKVITGEDGAGQYTGGITVDTTIQRLDARPATSGRSIFMGARNF